MRVAALGAAALSFAGVRTIQPPKNAVQDESIFPAAVGWSEETFAEEQIRGLVREVFSPDLSPPVQQVVFSPTECETDVRDLCLWVAEMLAREKHVEVAVIDESETCSEVGSARAVDGQRRYRTTSVSQFGVEIHKNLCAFPARSAVPHPPERASLAAYLTDVRREFEYSIVAAPAPAISSKLVEMARFADGIILVLSAQRTRRATALKVRNDLAHLRLLGTVFSDREFPMPNSLYRRL